MINIIAILCLIMLFRLIIHCMISTLAYGHDRCFEDMKNNGHVHEGKCCGCYGGDCKTDYLSEMCCDCKYLELTSSLK